MMWNRCTITTVIALVAFTATVGPQTFLGQAAQAPDRRLEHIRLQLRTIVDSTQKTDKTQFSVDEDVTVQVLATNSGSTQVSFVYWQSFIHYLPTLTRGGQVVPYSKAMEKRLAEITARGNPLGPDSAISVKLAANQLSEAALISLSYYYDKLQAGTYQLSVKFRERSGLTMQSDAIMFEVVN